MVDTPNNIATHIENDAIDKETSINTAMDQFDISNNDTADVDCSAGGTITVTATDYRGNIHLRLTGSPAGAFNLDVPDGKRFFVIQNTSGQTATVDTTTGGASTYDVLDTAKSIFQSRGTDLEEIVNSTPGSAIFGRRTEVFPAGSMWFPGTQPAGSVSVREVTGGQPSVVYIPFDSASEERVHFGGVPFPNRWDNGVITFQVGYTHAGGQTGGLDGVSWELKAVAVADDATFDVAFGTGVNVSLDRATADEVHVTAESANVTVAGSPADAYTVYFQLARDVADAADDLDIDAQLLFVRIFWTEDASVDD